MICLLIFLLVAGFGDTRNPSNDSLPIWLNKTGYSLPDMPAQGKERGTVLVFKDFPLIMGQAIPTWYIKKGTTVQL